MSKWILLTLIMLTGVLNSTAMADDVQQRAVAQEVFDRCKSNVLSAGQRDFQSLSPNDLAESCQEFPLSEDVFVQILGALVGPDLVSVLDVYTAITAKEHGFDAGSPLFTIAKPMHDSLAAFNYLMLGVFIFFVSVGLFTQMIHWQAGDFKTEIKDWMARHAANNSLTFILLVPFFGWLNLIQAIALLVVILIGFLGKLAVSYLFLAAFFGNTVSVIQEEVQGSLSKSFGNTVVLYQCDLERRERLISGIQNELGSRERSVLEQNKLFQCLVDPKQTELGMKAPLGTLKNTTFRIVPSALMSTQKCVEQFDAFITKEMEMEIPEPCGTLDFKLPRNSSIGVPQDSKTGRPRSLDNAMDLYANDQVVTDARELALKFHEYKCRTENISMNADVLVSSCMKASVSGDGYSYEFNYDPLSQLEELSNFNAPLTDTSRESFIEDVKLDMASIQNNISNNTTSLLAHIGDLLAPAEGEDDLPQGEQDKLERARQKVLDAAQGTGALGFSEGDADFLVNNIKRGMWTSGSLFFDGMADGLDKEVLAKAMSDTYSVSFDSGWNSVSFMGVTWDLMALDGMLQKEGRKDITKDQDFKLISGYILPRVGLYTENANCWIEQVECETPPLNPFTYLGNQGANLVEESLLRIVSIGIIDRTAKYFLGFLSREKTEDEKRLEDSSSSARNAARLQTLKDFTRGSIDANKRKFMILDTLSELVWLYFILGLIMCIVIPAIPLFKMLSMCITWTIDLMRELISLSIKLAVSGLGAQGKDVISADVREALVRIGGLGLYMLFITIGVISMFLMFSFLFSVNVFLVGSLASIINAGGDMTALDAMVVNIVFDVIVVFLLVFEVYKCSPYMEKIPKAMASHFDIQVTGSDGVVDSMFNFMKHTIPGTATNQLKSMWHGVLK